MNPSFSPEVFHQLEKNSPQDTGKAIDHTNGNIVGTEDTLPSLYCFSNTPEGEPVDWGESDLTDNSLPSKR
jgi:hypothetical protein